MRSKEDADGERRMMGSGRRAGALGLCARVVLFARFCAAGCCDFRALNGAASLRTCEKSYPVSNAAVSAPVLLTVGLIPLNTLFLSPILLSPL